MARYRDFHRVYEEGDYKTASQMLCLLLTSNLAPKSVWLTLLYDALPLLEGACVYFDSSETYELMRCLEECCATRDGDAKGVAVVRMALGRNLARAIFTQ